MPPSILGDLPRRQRYRVYARFVAILAGALGAYAFSVLVQENEYLWAVIPAVVLALATVAEFAVTDLLLDKRFPPESAALLDRLQQKLTTTNIHDAIVDSLNNCVRGFRGCDPSKISSTLHLRVDVLPDSDSGAVPSLIQVSAYTRKSLGGRRWRVLNPAVGLVGRCLRLNDIVWVNFRDRSEYDHRMVSEFGFSSDEVQRHTTSARSYLASPLRDEKQIVGVLYFFSTEPQVFPVAADLVELERTGQDVLRLLRVARIL
ncbi:GAF domain-containing protein [Nocardioides sp. W7]|uniref:GAF domain-containing protein n=1 Tax=Nocardioides sp. W7 TaxID=2931390 RepID=UPI001FD5AF23|nr:GAF domain-containing protein [Nocardioides sp. W7]